MTDEEILQGLNKRKEESCAIVDDLIAEAITHSDVSALPALLEAFCYGIGNIISLFDEPDSRGWHDSIAISVDQIKAAATRHGASSLSQNPPQPPISSGVN